MQTSAGPEPPGSCPASCVCAGRLGAADCDRRVDNLSAALYRDDSAGRLHRAPRWRPTWRSERAAERQSVDEYLEWAFDELRRLDAERS